jgi:hypothetical protein
MAELAACLERDGTSLIDDVLQRRGTHFRHTFTLAGFEDGIVRAFVISNFEDSYGKTRLNVDDHLAATMLELNSGSGAAVIVTGQPKAVPSVEKLGLRKLATRYPEDGGLIRRRMRRVNALAAASNDTISSDCSVISFRSDGYGILEPNDKPGVGPQHVPVVLNGVYLAKTMGKLGIDMSTMQMGSATFISTHNPGPARSLQSTCSFPVAGTDSSSGYGIHEITGADFEPLSAVDINEVGHVIGTGREEQKVPWTKQIPWLMKDDQVSRLNFEICVGFKRE